MSSSSTTTTTQSVVIHHHPNLYCDPPQNEETLPMMGEVVKMRIQLFQLLDKKKQQQQLDEKMFFQNKYQDTVSHFLLRMVVCQDTELIHWFLRNECAWMKYQLQYTQHEGIVKMMKEMEFPSFEYLDTNDLEIKELRQKLVQTEKYRRQRAGEKPCTSIEPVYYTVPFVHALHLIAKRKIYLHGGKAYVPSSMMSDIIVERFRTHLSQNVALVAKDMNHFQQQRRVMTIIMDIRKKLKEYLSTPSSSSMGCLPGLSAAQIPEVVYPSFPLCMRMMHRSLEEKHHMKFHGRRAYIQLLRAIRVNVDECVKYFSKLDYTFDKNDRYNIRHGYGLEGDHKNYYPPGCGHMITNKAQSPDDSCHVCPFKTANEQQLRALLIKDDPKLSQDVVDEIVNLAKGEHYQVACRALFQATHQGKPIPIQKHSPIVYYQQSFVVLKS